MKSQRQNEIVNLLLKEKTLETEKLSDYFNVSIETIRRDINQLEKEGLAEKVYGGIKMVSASSRIPFLESWNTRIQQFHTEKMLIATSALNLIPDGSTIALDFGTTTYELALLLHKKKNLHIITCSLRIAQELSINTTHKIYMAGGLITNDELVTSGLFCRDFLSNFASIDYFIFGADAVSLDTGVTDSLESVVDIKRYLVDVASKTIGLIDHSKFDKKASFYCFPLSKLDVLITDEQASPKILDSIKRIGVETIVAQN